MLRCFLGASLTMFLSVPLAAQLNYGGPAAPSMDLMIDITREMTRDNAIRGLANRGNGAVRDTARGFVGATNTSPFAAALSPASPGVTAVDTSFQRSATLQRESEAGILAEVKRRQPGAEAEYARIFAQQDMAKLFDRAVRGYGLRNNDIADTMAAYWLVSWVIANDAKDFSPAAARAVRDQVNGGIARTSVGSYSTEKKHHLADEAIFNTLIATQAFEYAQSGKISPSDYQRLSDVTQKAFLGFGADLRQLRLTDEGFVKR
jgi:hypothetical protein